MRAIANGNIGSIANVDAPPHARLSAAVIADAVTRARHGDRRERDWLRHGPDFWWAYVTPAGLEPADIRAYALDVVTERTAETRYDGV